MWSNGTDQPETYSETGKIMDSTLSFLENDMKTTIHTIIAGLFFVGVVALFSKQAHQPIKAVSSPVSVRTAPEPTIMSIRELQTALNAKGHSRYRCEVDGKMGKETLKAWSNYICDRQAKGEFE